MANLIAADTPELVLEMEAMERTTPAHYDEWNRRHQQFLDNDKFLHEHMMSAEDKAKLDDIEVGAQKNVGNPVYIQEDAPSDTSALWVY